MRFGSFSTMGTAFLRVPSRNNPDTPSILKDWSRQSGRQSWSLDPHGDAGAWKPFFNTEKPRSKIKFYHVTWHVDFHDHTWAQVILSSLRCTWMQTRGLQCINVRQVVIAITLTPAKHKRHMQFLISAPNFREGGVSWPLWPGLSEPQLWECSPVPVIGVVNSHWTRPHITATEWWRYANDVDLRSQISFSPKWPTCMSCRVWR